MEVKNKGTPTNLERLGRERTRSEDNMRCYQGKVKGIESMSRKRLGKRRKRRFLKRIKA